MGCVREAIKINEIVLFGKTSQICIIFCPLSMLCLAWNICLDVFLLFFGHILPRSQARGENMDLCKFVGNVTTSFGI